MSQHLQTEYEIGTRTQGDVTLTNVDLKVISTMLHAPQYSKDCPVKDPLSGLPLRYVEDNWSTSGKCGILFKFSCTSVGSGLDHCRYKKYRRFFPSQLNANRPKTIRINEPCKECGGSGMWEGVDISHTDSHRD